MGATNFLAPPQGKVDIHPSRSERMGTRGLFGFYFKGKYYLVYNHFDSDDLQENLLAEIRAAIEDGSIDSWIDKLDSIVVVSEDDTNYHKFRHCQGSFIRVLESGHLVEHPGGEGKLTGDRFIEYSCVLNIDDFSFTFWTANGTETKFTFPNWPTLLLK